MDNCSFTLEGLVMLLHCLPEILKRVKDRAGVQQWPAATAHRLHRQPRRLTLPLPLFGQQPLRA
jgi:hypothetical protein